MKRYYDNDSDDEKDPYFEPEDNEENDAIAYIDQQNVIDVMNIDLAQSDLNQKLLAKAIRIARQNWLWFFKSVDNKISDIEKIYQQLTKIMDSD